MQPEACAPRINSGQLVGISECGFHAGGGAKSLPCAEAGGHDEDAPIFPWYKTGTRVALNAPGHMGRRGTVVLCEGTCDDREVTVKYGRTVVKVSARFVRPL